MAEKDRAYTYTQAPMLSKVMIGGTPYYLKDAEAREVIDSILNDYLKTADKTELEGLISENADAIEAEEARAEEAEQTLQDNIDLANTEIAKKQDILGFEGEYDKETNKVTTKSYVDDLVGSLKTIEIKVVDKLPDAGESNVIYLVPKASPKTGYIEYVWVASASKFEEIGDTDIDLSNYYDKTEIDGKVSALNTAIDAKVAQSDYNTRVAALEKADKDNSDAIGAEKTRAEGVETDLAGKITTLEGASHTHDNKAELNKINEGDVALWNAEKGAKAAVTALSEGQVAANKSNIEALQTTVGNAESGLVKDLNDEKAARAQGDTDTLSNANNYTDTQIADKLKNLTDNLDSEKNGKHTHEVSVTGKVTSNLTTTGKYLTASADGVDLDVTNTTQFVTDVGTTTSGLATAEYVKSIGEVSQSFNDITLSADAVTETLTFTVNNKSFTSLGTVTKEAAATGKLSTDAGLDQVMIGVNLDGKKSAAVTAVSVASQPTVTLAVNDTQVQNSIQYVQTVVGAEQDVTLTGTAAEAGEHNHGIVVKSAPVNTGETA